MSDDPGGQGQVEQLFAERVKRMRAALDWSAQALANRLAAEGCPELTRVAISKIENKARRINLDEAAALCAAFGVTMEQMLSPEPVRLEIRAEVIV